MDENSREFAWRWARCTTGAALALLAPAVLQTLLLLQPHTQHAEVAMSLVLAATLVVVPSLLARSVAHTNE